MQRVVVIGAGAFGGWTALALQQAGARVTLIDAWGPGNLRASSGGETRIIRASYGTRPIYTRMTLRSLALWREHESVTRSRVFFKTGVLWMFRADDSFGRASAETIARHGSHLDELTIAAARREFPQIHFDDISSAFIEREAGYLLSRRACAEVVDRYVAAGGAYRLASASAPVAVNAPLRRLSLGDATTLEADSFVFACGPWLAQMFPDAVGPHLSVTRQEVFYFGPPAGDPRFTDTHLPAWSDIHGTQMYGIPGNAHRGFKLADDSPGEPIDPTSAQRDITPPRLAAARAFLAHRFPALAGAPLVGSEVCQYESTPDANFIIDRHPHADNVWIAGGGSGHGFKMGPAVGEHVAALVTGTADVEPLFALQRFAAPPDDGWRPKWS